MQIRNVRFIIAAITTFSAYAVYVSRVNLSIAIIAMVENPHRLNSTAQVNVVPSSNGNQTSGGSSIRFDNVVAAQVGFGANTTALTTADGVGNNQSHSRPHIFLTSEKSITTPLISQEKFHWSQAEQGHILGAFFYGYIVFQVIGARMAEAGGAKWILLAATAGSAVISLVFPLSSQLNSIYLLMVLRCVMGLCQSAFFPAAYVIFCRWLPEKERSVLLPVMFIGSNVGNISTYILSSHLISSSYGWPSVFYLSGLVCTLVSVLWFVFGSNGPNDNWLISDEERLFIEQNVNNQSSESNSMKDLEFGLDENNNEKANSLLAADGKQPTTCCKIGNNNNNIDHANHLMCGNEKSQANCKLRIPTGEVCGEIGFSKSSGGKLVVAKGPSWVKLFKSMPIWVLILSMYGNEWSNVVLLFELPTYLNTALKFPIEKNGVINSFLQLSFVICSPMMSTLGAHMLDQHVWGMRKLHVRKLFQSVACFGQLLCFVMVPICGANSELIILFMFMAIIFRSCANAGDIMVPGDLSQEYAGTIFAFANTVGNTAGFFVPNLAGYFVVDAYDREQWTPFWLTTAAIMCSSGLIFILLGETRRQDFSIDDGSELTGESDEVKAMELPELARMITRTEGMEMKFEQILSKRC